MLSLAFALEAKSEHPLAKAIVEEGKSKFDQTSLQADEFSALPGNGLEGTVNGHHILGGSVSLLSLEKSLSVLRIGKRQHLLPRVERHHFCLQKTSSFGYHCCCRHDQRG